MKTKAIVSEENMCSKNSIDLTLVFTASMPTHPFDEPSKIEKIRDLKTHSYNDWRLTTGMHAGTHIDGPGHLTDSSVLLSDLPIERFVGKGFLVDARGKSIDAALLANCPNEPGLIVLILTGQDKKFGTPEYFTDYPVFSDDFAHELVRRQVKMVGLDAFSPDTYPFPIHQLLFKNDILIIENLTGLERLVGIKDFDVFALPLKTATDSALARVIAVAK